jgi:hypothetical protein
MQVNTREFLPRIAFPGEGVFSMDKAYMLILGYRLDHSVDLTSIARTVT